MYVNLREQLKHFPKVHKFLQYSPIHGQSGILLTHLDPDLQLTPSGQSPVSTSEIVSQSKPGLTLLQSST